MIPAFNASGVIPPFVVESPVHRGGSPYEVCLKDVAEVFATTEARLEIFKGLLRYRQELRKVGITSGFQLIDGSFTENCEQIHGRSPNDIDIVTFAYLPVMQHELKSFVDKHIELFDQSTVKDKFKCDAYFVDLSKDARLVVEDTMYWYGLFSHQRDTNLWKGMLRVPLLDEDEKLLDELQSEVTNA